MPVTPLHYPIAYLLSKTDNRLSLPALIVGAVIPDIEVPIMWLFFSNLQDHFILHSLVGALTIGLLLTIILTRFLYTPLVSTIFGVDKEALNENCKISSWMILSCLLGIISHLLLDYPMHWYNPILWPWVNPDDVIGPLLLIYMPTYSLETAFFFARLVTHYVMVVLWLIILAHLYLKGNLWYRHWVKDD